MGTQLDLDIIFGKEEEILVRVIFDRLFFSKKKKKKKVTDKRRLSQHHGLKIFEKKGEERGREKGKSYGIFCLEE